MKNINTYFDNNLLFKNSIILIISNGFLSIGGFLFWILVARFYSTYDIGIATSLISMVGLISSLSLFGLNTGAIKYLPITKSKNILINSILSLIAITSLVISLIVILNLNIFSPPLDFVVKNPYFIVLFVILTIFSSLNMLLEAILTAFRSTKYILIKNIAHTIFKLFMPIFFVSLGGYGIFSSFYGGAVVAFLLGVSFLCKKHNIIYEIKVSFTEIKKVATLSLGTYTSGLLPSAALYVLPILITNILGAEQTAYYYIVATTTTVLNLIPLVIAQNLMVEGAYNISKIAIHFKKAMLLTYALLIPSVILILLFGNYILLVFGKEYSSEGLALLRLLSISSLFVGVNYILSTLLITFEQIKILVIINTIYALVLLSTSYSFIHRGIVGIGYASILSQVLLLVLYIFSLINYGNKKSKS